MGVLPSVLLGDAVRSIDGHQLSDAPPRREPAEEALLRALKGPRPAGAVLYADPVEAQAVVDAVMERRGGAGNVVHLHGSPFASAFPYGTLSFILAGLPEVPLTPRHHLVRSLARALNGLDGPTTVVVSGAAHVDVDTMAVLAQLAQQAAIRLIVNADHLADVPADFEALARGGVLEAIRVEPLDLAGLRSAAAAHLDAPLTSAAVRALHRAGAGRPGRLAVVVEELVTSGRLAAIDGTWVHVAGETATGEEPEPWPADATGDRRTVLELLALHGRLPTRRLAGLGLAESVDGLRTQGLVHPDPTAPGHLVLDRHLDGDAARAELAPERRAELGALLPQVGPAAVLAAANDLIDAGGPAAALEALEDAGLAQPAPASTVGTREWCGIVVTRERALVAVGDDAGAARLLDAALARAAAGGYALPAVVERLRLSRARTALRRGELDEALTETAPGPAPAPAGVGASASGHAASTPRAAVSGTTWGGDGLRLEATAIRAAAFAWQGRNGAARDLADRVAAELDYHASSGHLADLLDPGQLGDIAHLLLEVRLADGDWPGCREAAAALARSGSPAAGSAERAELICGMLDALGGHLRGAAEQLEPLAQQLARTGRPDDFGLARAALAGLARHPGAPALAPPAPTAPPRTATRQRAIPPAPPVPQPATARTATAEPGRGPTSYLARLLDLAATSTATTLAGTGQPTRAGLARDAARFAELADDAAAHGNRAVALLALAHAVRAGDAGRARALREAARGHGMAFAGPCQELADGVLERDPARIASALEGFAARGYAAFAEEPGNLLLPLLSEGSARRVARAAVRCRGHRGADRAEAPAGAGPAWAEALTARERETALLVLAGHSNAEIARLVSVSVRTVEGHLYQAYSKLGLTGRQELLALAAVESVLGSGP
ncbi:LuxR C-terminal-related transcriptional regulator [Zafaria sp. Z1313]|uniref:helix-turn-helix transcriptional regulator n=1 Tax=unclassified Zafaria TaxID=2828765 RepID=UPI002E7628D3|nr:helix-turn-helix transcriptional regulator [Zafaria sp. J156]MEE1620485.1 helix-turn-helix transcriptional regulator [Zafaria sp. J156]